MSSIKNFDLDFDQTKASSSPQLPPELLHVPWRQHAASAATAERSRRERDSSPLLASQAAVLERPSGVNRPSGFCLLRLGSELPESIRYRGKFAHNPKSETNGQNPQTQTRRRFQSTVICATPKEAGNYRRPSG